MAVAALLGLGGLVLAWQSQSRLNLLEQELVRRQEGSQTAAAGAQEMARQAQELTRDTAAKVALLDARLAEVALQREQLEALLQSMSRSRDENLVGDLEASLRVAQQQTTITGSAEPLVAALRHADDRLTRYKQPRLEGVRRAVARDLDRVRAVSVVDVATLSIKLDEAVRHIDELPLIAQRPESDDAEARRSGKAAAQGKSAPTPAQSETDWLNQQWSQLSQRWSTLSAQAWSEAKGLLRVTRIGQPEAMLLAPEQAFFLRENLKLRLLNARLALLSRQYDTAQADLRDSLAVLDRYFDTRSRKVQLAQELLRQVTAQARAESVPRPDDTLAALAAAAR
ncbi:uroporphyrinogen-III C-methyltransferase [Roseateles sp. BYS180W]|uniref:Uroporphyrinogen-III C-methyltransferase n=1 Tax=Roseateles rivi TaxID=3299028 RepID=A0ABW7FVJ6_9BURK